LGNPFHFADRFSGAVVHLTTGGCSETSHLIAKQRNNKNEKCPRQSELAQAFPD
jgi:hypothetical protein